MSRLASPTHFGMFLLCSVSVVIFQGCNEQLPATSNWQLKSVGNGNLKIKFPKSPKQKNVTEQSAIGPLDIVIDIAEYKNIAFMASTITYDIQGPFDVDAGLDGAVNGAVSNTNSSQISVSDISKNGLKGKEFICKSPAGIFNRSRYYMDENGPTLHQASILAKSEAKLNSEEALFFLDSMEFEKLPSKQN